MSAIEMTSGRFESTAAEVVDRIRDEGLGLMSVVFSDITGGAKALTIHPRWSNARWSGGTASMAQL